MSFHSSLTADAVWPADVRSALSLTDTGSVYTGRQARPVKQAVEVWLERLPQVDLGDGAGYGHKLHRYSVHVLAKAGVDGDRTLRTAEAVVEAHMQTIVDRYHGELPFVATLTGLRSVSAVEEGLDVSEVPGAVEGIVTVSFHEET